MGPHSIAAPHWNCKHQAHVPQNQNLRETISKFFAFIVYLKQPPTLRFMQFVGPCSQGMGWDSKAPLLQIFDGNLPLVP